MRHATVAALAAVLLGPCAAAAEPAPAAPDPNAEVPTEELRGWNTYVVEADGRYVHDADYIVLVRSEKGIQQESQVTLPYTESRETLEVLEAYTEEPDGRHVPVPPDKILTRESPLVTRAPMYADVKVVSIIFPDVEVHSKLHFRVRRTEKEPLFPGYFQITDAIGPHALRDDERIDVYAAVGQRRDLYRTRFALTSLASLPGPGAFTVPAGLQILPVAQLAQAAPIASRRYPWACGIPGDRKETTHLTLPAAMHIVGGPKNVHLQNDYGWYDAHYEQAGSAITVTREFAHTTTQEPCDEAHYQQFRALVRAIDRDVKAQYPFQ